jgi:hypothetical protein
VTDKPDSHRNRIQFLEGATCSPLFFMATRQALGPTQPHVKWKPGVKRLRHETDHSPNIVHLHPVAHCYFTFTFTFHLRLLCGLSMF